MILSAVLRGWLAVVMHIEPFICGLLFCIGEYFQGNVILFVCNVPFLPVLVSGLAVCIAGLFSLNFMQYVYLTLRRVMSHVFISTIAVYSKRETIFIRKRHILFGILITLSSQL